MAYIYLLNLYEEIEKRFKQINSVHGEKTERTSRQQGQIDILNEFKIFLNEHMNSKLPKRIRKKIADRQQ